MAASLTAVRLGGRPDLPLLVLGPSLGTSARSLWSDCAAYLAADFQVVAWDLPGHGTNTAPLEGPVTVADLAAALLELVDSMAQGLQVPAFHYAGASVGGAVGLQLLLDAPHRLASATLLGTGAVIGDPASWHERARVVTERGTEAMVEGSTRRWFGTGFVDREPARAAGLLRALTEADDEGYAAVCGALAGFDVHERLGEVAVPVLAVAGSEDGPTPPERLREIADGVVEGRLEVLDGVAHLAPAEAPEAVARLLREHALGPAADEPAAADLDDLARAVRAARAGGAARDEVEQVVRRALDGT